MPSIITFCDTHFVGIDEYNEANGAYKDKKDPKDLWNLNNLIFFILNLRKILLGPFFYIMFKKLYE